MKVPRSIVSLLREEDDFLIASHLNPDGDAIGSCLALSAALDGLGKRTTIYNKDAVPSLYRFMPGCDRITPRFARTGRGLTVLLLDCNDPERAALDGISFRRAAVIDHHETETSFGDVRWIDPHAAATGLMVLSLIKALNASLTPAIATNLYTAIAMDTGTFRFSNTSADVLCAGAELVEAGAEPHLIADKLYETWDRKRFDLLRLTLNTLEIRGNVAMMYVTDEMFRRTKTVAEHTENFSNFPRMITTVAISALFRSIGRNRWKVSLRSKGNVNVAKIAQRYGGGGHRNAAGFIIEADIDSAKKELLSASRRAKS